MAKAKPPSIFLLVANRAPAYRQAGFFGKIRDK